ncbi:hypothetical protein Q5530_30370 [Saccharothrix sp. BKS2]|uniref:Uncharacterized protein n=1 Tax=Saccharothrix lopnurensis TaxID=1670621 RepID=A0ABW1PAI6_9PSEU
MTPPEPLLPEPPVPEPVVPLPAVPGTALPGAEPARVDLGRVDLGVELADARAELRDHLACGDHEMADLLGAWIDALLDEWNRRRC